MSSSPYSGAALRRSAWHFLTGKVVSALLTFVTLLLVVRVLSVAEYGAYVTLVAGIELAIAITALGLHWVAARYLPEYRLHAPGPLIRELVLRLLGWQGALLAGFAILLWLGLGHYLAWANLSAHRDAALLCLLVLLAEGVGRFARESLLGSLLLQGAAQVSMVLRNLAFIALLGMAVSSGDVQLIDVVRAELAASVLGTIMALLGLFSHLAGMKLLAGHPGWRESAFAEMWRTASHMYLAHLLTLLYSPQVFLLLIQRVLGAEVAAVFGFLRSLYEQIGRHLPATLLFSLVRPKLVASYVGGGGVKELARNANLAGKLSLFVLMPVVAFAGVGGERLIALLSGAKFMHTGLLFLGFMLALIPVSQRQLLETVAVAVGDSASCTRAAASGLFMLPLMVALLHAGLGLWSAVIALGAGHLVFNAIILARMARRTGYQSDVVGFYKLLAAAVASYLVAVWPPPVAPAWLGLMAEALLATAAFLLAAWSIKPFSEVERARLNGLVSGHFFIW